MNTEHATFALTELKLAGGATRSFSGYASVFGNVDAHGDVIAPGAFRRTLAEHAAAKTKPKMLSQHGGFLGGNPNPIGVWTRMVEDDVGLKVEGYLSDTEAGREAHVLLKDGALDGLSIGYEVPPGGAINGTRPGEPRRKLIDIDLWEVSLVTFPSNPRSRVDSVKLADGNFLTARDAERALRDAGLPRELAKAIMAKGWRAATDRRDDDGQVDELLDALKSGAAELEQTIRNGRN